VLVLADAVNVRAVADGTVSGDENTGATLPPPPLFGSTITVVPSSFSVTLIADVPASVRPHCRLEMQSRRFCAGAAIKLVAAVPVALAEPETMFCCCACCAAAASPQGAKATTMKPTTINRRNIHQPS
jgi:hypothetical protein